MSITERQLDRLEERIGERLAAKTSARTDYTEYADDPVRFAIEVLKFEPWSKQVEVLRSVHVNKKTVVMGHHGAGKDAILGVLLLWAAYARTMVAIAISATERQLIGQLWAEVTRRWDRADLPGEMFVGELRIGGEKRIVGMTSGSTSNLTGWHNHRGTGVFVAISESQAEQVGAAAFDAAEGNTAGTGSRIVVVGNPVKTGSRFHEASRKPTWNAITISALDHPNIREGRAVIPGGPSPDWPAEMAAEYGEDSAFYASRVLGRFPTEGSVDAMFRREWFEPAYLRHEVGESKAKAMPPVFAWDVARSTARDENVCGVARGARLERLIAWRSRDLVASTRKFLMIVDRVRLEHFADGAPIDETGKVVQDQAALAAWLKLRAVPDYEMWIDAPGVGSGPVDIARDGGRQVNEFWGWNPARDQKRMANTRAETLWTFRKLLENGQAALPRDPRLEEEALAVEYTLDAKGRILVMSKDDLRKHLGRSTDRLDPTVIALSAATGAIAAPSIRTFPVSV